MAEEDPTDPPEIDPTDPPEDDPPEGDPVDPPEDALGDAGKMALDAMKAKWKAERDARKKVEGELATAQAAKVGDGAEAQAEKVRRDAEAAATTKANARIIRSEVRAAATGKLADPKDALTFLDLEQFEVDENGEIDTDEVASAIDDLVKSKPYLAAAKARFQGTGDNGAQRTAGKAKQVTDAELKTMNAEQIDKAREEGRLADLLGAS